MHTQKERSNINKTKERKKSPEKISEKMSKKCRGTGKNLGCLVVAPLLALANFGHGRPQLLVVVVWGLPKNMKENN